MAKIDDLKSKAALIENETAIGGNTAKRVGGAIGTAAVLIEQQANDLDAAKIEIGHIDKSYFSEIGWLKSTGEVAKDNNWRTGYVNIPSGARYINIKNYSEIPNSVVHAITYNESGKPVKNVSLANNDVKIDATDATRVRFSVELSKLNECKVIFAELNAGDIASVNDEINELQAESAKRNEAYQLVADTITSNQKGVVTFVREDDKYVNHNGNLTNGNGIYGSNVYKVTGVSRLYISTTIKDNPIVKIWCAVKNGAIVKSGALTTVASSESVDISSIEFDEIYVSWKSNDKNTSIVPQTQILATLDDVDAIEKEAKAVSTPNTDFRELNFVCLQNKDDLLKVLTEVGWMNGFGYLNTDDEWRTGSLTLPTDAKMVYLSSPKSTHESVSGCYINSKGKKIGFFKNSTFPLRTYIPAGAVAIRVSLRSDSELKYYALEKDVVFDIDKRVSQNESDIASLKNATVDNVKIVVPSVLYAVVGNEFNIYYDTIVKALDAGLNSPRSMYVDISCPDLCATMRVGVMRDRYWHIEGSNLKNTHVGDHTLVIRIFGIAGKEIGKKSCTLRVVQNVGLTKATNILCIGDSLTSNGPVVATMGEDFNSIGGTQPTFVGQRTTNGYNHEGYTGYTFGSFVVEGGYKYHIFKVPIGTNVIVGDKYSSSGNTYVVYDIRTEGGTTKILSCQVLTGTAIPPSEGTLTKISGAPSSSETITYSKYECQSSNPFWNQQTSRIDFADYRKRMGMGSSKFDIVVIMLGTNDCIGNVKNMAFSVSNAKKLIGAILNDAGTYSTKVILQLTPADASTPSGWQVYSDKTEYSKKMCYWANYWSLRELLEEEFTTEEYEGKVYIGQATLGVDRYYGYGISSVTPAKRVSEGFSSLLEDYHKNCVVPSTVGYKQFGDGYFLQALGLLKEQ